MPEISIYKKIKNDFGWEYTVRLTEKERHTEHLVSVPLTTAQRLTGNDDDPDDLVIHSFEFLLAHEPKESILPKFDIESIGQYFPDWEQTILQPK